LAIANAKRGQLSKPSIEHAIAAGQGKSVTGAALENLTLEVMLPATVAAIIECQTDNKIRTLHEVRHILTRNGGTLTPTAFLFEKKGKIWFGEKADVGADNIMDEAIEAGATDITTEDGMIVVETEPSDVTAVAAKLQELFKLQIHRSGIIYDANEDTMVELDEKQGEDLQRIIELVEDDPAVQNVYTNAA
jgi:transcriptional/translational regulatory protein YebC/TACO1